MRVVRMRPKSPRLRQVRNFQRSGIIALPSTREQEYYLAFPEAASRATTRALLRLVDSILACYPRGGPREMWDSPGAHISEDEAGGSSRTIPYSSTKTYAPQVQRVRHSQPSRR